VLKEGKITQLALYNVNGLQENQRNQFVWEPLKIFKFGGQFSRTTSLKCQVFLSFEIMLGFHR
jgi:hypothetical protein